jgi:hypothetical protein
MDTDEWLSSQNQLGGSMEGTKSEMDQNDQALIGHFLRSMFRFQKFVRAQDIFCTATDEHVAQRIDAAYVQAREQFVTRQRGSKK